MCNYTVTYTNLSRKSFGVSCQEVLAWLRRGISSPPDVPRRTYGKYPFIAASEKNPFEKPPPLIVEKIFVPFVLHQFGDDHDNVAAGMLFGKIEDELNDGNDDEAIRGGQDVEQRRHFA